MYWLPLEIMLKVIFQVFQNTQKTEHEDSFCENSLLISQH